jgi:hypothetical protein
MIMGQIKEQKAFGQLAMALFPMGTSKASVDELVILASLFAPQFHRSDSKGKSKDGVPLEDFL